MARLSSWRRYLLTGICAVGLVATGADAQTTYSYDAIGRLVRVMYANGTTVTYSYDAAGNRIQRVSSVNIAPVANPDSLSIALNQAITFYPLTNDTDANGDTLTISGKTNGTHGGTVAINNPSLTYTPPTNYSGSDSFTYTISDGRGGTSTATDTVTISSSPDVTPDPVNWSDISVLAVCPCTGSTNTQTITGISAPITLSLTYTMTGAGTLSYVKNGTTTSFTSGQTVTVSNGDTLYFTAYQSGLGTTSGTVTVTNQTNANTVLDTFNYSVQYDNEHCPLC